MARKKVPTRAVAFRTPVSHYEALVEVARSRGVGLTAVLNRLVADNLGAFAREVAERRRARPPAAGTAAEWAALRARLPPADLAAVRAMADAIRSAPAGIDELAYARAILRRSHKKAKLSAVELVGIGNVVARLERKG